MAGFWLIPALGLAGTTRVAMFASSLAACAALVLVSSRNISRHPSARSSRETAPRHKRRKQAPVLEAVQPRTTVWLPMLVVTVSGIAGLVHEIAWARVLTLVLGPTIYAFAAALAAVILGAAIGSGLGASVAARSRHVKKWLALTLAGAAISAAEMTAVSCVLLTNVVVRFAPFHLTVEFETKFVPFTVNVNAEPPEAAELGSRLVSDGTPALTEI